MKKSFEIEFKWEHYFIVSEKNIIRQKENSEIEFKESFHSPKSKDKKLHKWIASFANSNGGLILYGVNDAGELIGLQNKKLQKFDNKDLSQELLDYFAPEIKFELFIKKINTVEIGFLYIYKSENKPVITIKSANNTIQEGDIFFRYPGQSRKISYGDLRNILEEKQNQLNEKWLKLISNVATIGVENIGLLNIVNGELIGSKNKLLIPQDLLKKLTFINEGKFVEKDGAPTLKLIGDVQPVDSTKIIKVVQDKFHVITHVELYKSFFKQDLDVDDSKEFFKKVLHESTPYYPIYFYILNSKLSDAEINKILNKNKGDKVSERLSTEKDNFTKFKNGQISTETASAKKITTAYNAFKAKQPVDFSAIAKADARYYIQAITHLQEDEIDIIYIVQILKGIYDAYFGESSQKRTLIRKAICHIDLVFHGKKYFDK